MIAVAGLSTVCSKETRGIVIDADSIPMEFANVTAFSNDSVTAATMTDSIGSFRLDIGDNCDRLKISFIGYDDVFIPRPGENIGRIILTPTSTTLKEVVVKAPLIRREADRIVLNIAANPLAANKDARELLRTAPGVWADDDALSIYGQSGTTVYIDDRRVNLSGQQLMTYLKTLQSSSIASIEIIPKAGAEYNADSAGGVIRINLRRARIDGVAGSAGMSLTAGEYKQFANPFVNINLHSGKWSANLSGSLNGSPSDRSTSHEESTSMSEMLTISGVSRHKSKILQGNLMTGVFYEPSARDRFGLQIEYNHDRTRHTSDSRTEIYGEENSVTKGDYRNISLLHNLNATFNWIRQLDNDGSALKLISNYNYRQSSSDEDNIMKWSDNPSDSIFENDNTSRYNIFVTELSINKKFGTGWTFGAGVKYNFNNVAYGSRHRHLSDHGWVSNLGNNYDDSYDEHIAAVYATLNRQAGRWKFKAGIRGEYYRTQGDILSASHLDLFPNAGISLDLTEKGDYTVSLGYNRNIRRPSFQSLNPTVTQVSDYSYTVGNPDLKPSFSDGISLDFLLAGKFTVATGYTQTSNPIRQMFRSNPDHPERMYLTWGNVGKARNGFIHADGFLSLTGWWSLYSGITYILTSQILDDTQGYDTFGYLQVVASTTFRLPKDLSLTVNCFYNSKMKIGNISVYPILNLNPTLQKSLGSKWTISVGMENLLQRTTRTRTSSSGYDRLAFTKAHMAAKLSVTYNFNSGKQFRTRRIESNADKSRLGKE